MVLSGLNLKLNAYIVRPIIRGCLGVALFSYLAAISSTIPLSLGSCYFLQKALWTNDLLSPSLPDVFSGSLHTFPRNLFRSGRWCAFVKPIIVFCCRSVAFMHLLGCLFIPKELVGYLRCLSWLLTVRNCLESLSGFDVLCSHTSSSRKEASFHLHSTKLWSWDASGIFEAVSFHNKLRRDPKLSCNCRFLQPNC